MTRQGVTTCPIWLSRSAAAKSLSPSDCASSEIISSTDVDSRDRAYIITRTTAHGQGAASLAPQNNVGALHSLYSILPLPFAWLGQRIRPLSLPAWRHAPFPFGPVQTPDLYRSGQATLPISPTRAAPVPPWAPNRRKA